MYSQSLVSPQILLPHISFNTKTRVQKPTTNDVKLPGFYRAFQGVLDNGAGFEVPTCTNRMAEKISSIKTHHVPYTLILCASAPSLRTGCLLSSKCHCTQHKTRKNKNPLLAGSWTQHMSWFWPTTTHHCHFGYKLTHSTAKGLPKPWQNIFKYLSALLLCSFVFSSVSTETFPKCQRKQKGHKTDMNNIIFLD